MELTPMEIRQKQFTPEFRGISKREAEEFLQLVSEGQEDLIRENNEIKDKVQKLKHELDEHREREKVLRETLVAAQKMAEDMKSNAGREANLILSNAEAEGERIVDDFKKKRELVVSEIHELKRQKIQFETTLRNSLEMHLKLLDALKDEEEELKEIHNHPKDPPTQEEQTAGDETST